MTLAKNNNSSFISQFKPVLLFLLSSRRFYCDRIVVKQLKMVKSVYGGTLYKQSSHYYKYNIYVDKHLKHSLVRTSGESGALQSLKAKTMLAQLTQAVTHSHWH